MRYLIILLLLTSCAWNKAWEKATPVEKGLYACLVATTVTDMVTTDKVLDQGGYELNPLLTKHPNNEALYVFAVSKLIINTVFGYYFDWWRLWGWGTSCAGGIAFTIQNEREIE